MNSAGHHFDIELSVSSKRLPHQIIKKYLYEKWKRQLKVKTEPCSGYTGDLSYIYSLHLKSFLGLENLVKLLLGI